MTDFDPIDPELDHELSAERRRRERLAFVEGVQHDLLVALERHGCDLADTSHERRWAIIHAVFEICGVLLQEAITAQGEPARTRAMTMARDLALYLHGHPSGAAH